MMADNDFRAALSSSGEIWLRLPLPLLRQLESSLCHSRTALLALDLAGIELETREPKKSCKPPVIAGRV